MFDSYIIRIGVLLHQIFFVISTICLHSIMFLRRTGSFKWFREQFQSRGNAYNNSTSHNDSTAITTRPPEGIDFLTTLSENLENALVLVNDTKIDTVPQAAGLTQISDDTKKEDTSSLPAHEYEKSSIAPIARVDDVDVEETCIDICCISNQSMQCCQIIDNCKNTELPPIDSEVIQEHRMQNITTENTVRRSKSRVRTYLRKCKDRLTGHHQHQHHQQQQHHHQQMQHVNEAPLEISIKSSEQQNVQQLEQKCVIESMKATLMVVDEKSAIEDNLPTLVTIAENDNDDENDAYEDIDFSLFPRRDNIIARDNKSNKIDSVEQRNNIVDKEIAMPEIESTSISIESGIDFLIDTYLSSIFPAYYMTTRAILIRQARDVLVCNYQGCLHTFEKEFLCEFAKIAENLRQRHEIGASLIWCKGWPLATPTGELILHLGALDQSLVRSTDIYLCVKIDCNNDIPKLHAVWRSANKDSATNIHSRCINLTDPKAYLSIITLEMLSDDLPQLLQNLLVGVERTIGRISLNDFQMNIADNSNSGSSTNNNSNSGTSAIVPDDTNGNHLFRPNVLNSPKCALKRSELITKNKLIHNKYMLRRLTNRQDSMNSTSSGNSCTSSTSTTSGDEILQYNNSINNKNKNNSKINDTTVKPASTSPALPLFCLGNSFPHIDSDEENSADEKKRNSIEGDNFENEIVPPSSILDMPEKLLNSGINLPGTRDCKGHSIVTIDAENIISAGLNCYEIATVLLFYSTIPEMNSNHLENSKIAKQSAMEQSKLQTPITVNYPAFQQQSEQTTIDRLEQQHQQHNNQQTFTILTAIEKSHHLCVVDLICQSLKLLRRQLAYCEIFAIFLDRALLQLSKNNAKDSETTKNMVDNNDFITPNKQQEVSSKIFTVKYISVDEATTSVAPPSQLPYKKFHGLHHHDAQKWCEFFQQLEPFQSQCAAAGQRLVTAMSDIRSSDLQGLPTRRQLYAQHRALSRALMDSELHNLRKCGATSLKKLQDLACKINSNNNYCNIKNNPHNDRNSSQQKQEYGGNKSTITSTTLTKTSNYSFNTTMKTTTNITTINSMNNNNHDDHLVKQSNNVTSSDISTIAITGIASPITTIATSVNTNRLINNNNSGISDNYCCNNIDVAIRLHKVSLLFNEVDRAAKRLEQLTEQRRERLRELTRQRALEDEIMEVTSWITSDGNESLQRFTNLQFENETIVKENEQEFEKYYFISMKHLAKGRDLHDAAEQVEALRESAINLKTALDCFAEKLEQTHERIEGASRLHHLLESQTHDDCVQLELERLAEQIGLTGFIEKYQRQYHHTQHYDNQQQQCQQSVEKRIKPNSLNLNCSQNNTKSQHNVMTSTPVQKSNRTSYRSSSGNGSFDGGVMMSQTSCQHCWRDSRHYDDNDELMDEELDGEEEQSKIADSGVGGCDRCEGNLKLTRICSCQSLNETQNLYDKRHNCDELDDEGFERPSKRYLDIHSPLEANAHLNCHASNLELPKMEELSNLDPKIQKTLLLIMREMIGTERDYVRSLYYVIENYVDELLRDDIPQPLRGQRNVIFGNIEKIFEFHNLHFLNELERYERYPLKVGAAFLEMESKFYLYALYNKNKPKSDTLMSEYGTTFFKSKQFELNDKMDLASYLLKPVQRMGKYALLLQQLVKACNSVEETALQEISNDVEELQRAEEMVKFQLRHGNDLLAMDSLRDCDVNVKEQGRLLRQNEFLVWQGRGGKKTLRQIFLFEELVLFSKARRFPDHKNLDIYIYKNSIKTADIGLTVGDSPTKFEIWFRKRKPTDTWTLQCMSEDIKNAWTEEISKILWKQAKRNREIRMAEMSSMGIGSKPCLDIRPSHNQINDRSITISQLGKAPKLRHSFAGINTEHNKNRRPNSIMSESSISSGTSSSSLSTGSSSGHERLGSGLSNSFNNRASLNQHALELINETQTLKLSDTKNNNANIGQQNNTNTLSSSDGSTSGINVTMRNKRSTTLSSQLSMESGILSDFSMTPEQEQADSITTTIAREISNTLSTTKTPTDHIEPVLPSKIKSIDAETKFVDNAEEILSDYNNVGSNPYLKEKTDMINL